MSPKIIFLLLLLLSSSNCITKEEIIAKLKAFLQNNISNEIVIDFLEILRVYVKKDFPSHLSQNRDAFKNHIAKIKANKGLIEDQGNYGDMNYGVLPLSQNGCELIAIYNALYILTKKEDIDFPLIIDMHEKDGILLNGLFGTSMRAIQEYFVKNGFKTHSSSKNEDYEKIANESDVLILTMYNNRYDITAEIHTIAITKANGKYYVHNNSCNPPSIGYNSITEVLNKLNNGLAKDIFLIGINKK